MSKPKKKQEQAEKETDLNFGNLEFEEVLEDLLKIKPVENKKLVKDQNKKAVKTKRDVQNKT